MHPGGFLASPWRIKMVERIRRSTRDQRDQVFIDLLTDSGTGAMSDRQWADLLLGDETYAGSSSFSLLHGKATAVDCPLDNAFCIGEHHPFKGNVDLQKLKDVLDSENNNVPMLCDSHLQQDRWSASVPDNMRRVKALAREYRIPVVFDSADSQRMPGSFRKGSPAIPKRPSRKLSGKCIRFTKYGGMAGRDMEALAIGLDEATCSDYLDSRIGQVQRLGDRLIAAGIPVQRPVGGHAIVVDASAFLPLVPKDEYAAQ
ncbi:pyridoxal phosphate-dependent transferase, partial [Fusarium solani]